MKIFDYKAWGDYNDTDGYISKMYYNDLYFDYQAYKKIRRDGMHWATLGMNYNYGFNTIKWFTI